MPWLPLWPTSLELRTSCLGDYSQHTRYIVCVTVCVSVNFASERVCMCIVPKVGGEPSTKINQIILES